MKAERITAEAVAPYVARAAGEHLRGIMRQVLSGECQAYRLDDGQAYAVVRPQEEELVVVLFEGREWLGYVPKLWNMAAMLGFSSVRGHFQRRGIEKWARELGCEFVETVYRKRLR